MDSSAQSGQDRDDRNSRIRRPSSMERASAVHPLWDAQKRIRGLLTQASASRARAPEMTDGVIRELRMEVEIYAALEQEILYPELEASVPDAAPYTAQGRERLNELRAIVKTHSGQDFLAFGERIREHFE